MVPLKIKIEDFSGETGSAFEDSSQIYLALD